jgi:hypothetical protein
MPAVIERCVSGRLVRAYLRYLRERVGEPSVEAALRLHPVAAPAGSDWVPMASWQPLVEELERRHGDPATLRLSREITRSTMAEAVSVAWSRFLAGATLESLFAQTGRFWSLSYNSGRLVLDRKGPHRALITVEDWPDPPAIVAASVAEAAAVFLARLGEHPRAIDRIVEHHAEIELTW